MFVLFLTYSFKSTTFIFFCFEHLIRTWRVRWSVIVNETDKLCAPSINEYCRQSTNACWNMSRSTKRNLQYSCRKACFVRV